MYRHVLILFIAIGHQHLSKSDQSTDIEYRIEALKRQLLSEIKKPGELTDEYPVSDLENYEYVDLSNRPITPIMDFDPRKLKAYYKSDFKTTKSKYVPPPDSDDEKPLRTNKKPKRKPKPKRKRKLRKPPVTEAKEIFYRKAFFNTHAQKNTENSWIHCVDLFTPYLYGYMDKVRIKYFRRSDQIVKRVIHLIATNSSGYDAEDIRAILYQMSNLRIHLFNWDQKTIQMLLDAIIKDKEHSFRALKWGMKHILYNMWSLDLTNIESILKQMRIFRPPCLPVTKNEGSTRTSRAVTYYKLKSTKNLCLPKDKSDERSGDDPDCD